MLYKLEKSKEIDLIEIKLKVGIGHKFVCTP